MKALQIKNQIPWHRERANKLHRICSSIAGRHDRGERLHRLISWFAWYYKGHNYRGDPSRPLSFSKQTIKRAFYLWRKGGQVAAALLPQYKPRRTALTAPVFVRFAGFSASTPLPSMRAAWQKFSARGGSYGRGKHASQPLKISYGKALYHFRAADFCLLQNELKSIRAAQIRLASSRLKVVADIRSRLPDRLSRRRVKREINFQI